MDLAQLLTLPDLGTVVMQALLLGVLLLVSAFLSGSEVALLGFSRVRRLQLQEEGDPRVAVVERLMANPDRLLISILVGNVVANATAAALFTSFVAGIFAAQWSIALAIGIVAFLLLTFGEVIPKGIAARNPEKWALAAAPWLLWLQTALYPLVVAYEKATRHLFARRDGGKRSVFKSEEEIKALITVGTEEGVLERKEEDMLHSVIEFGQTTAKEIIVPRIDMTAVAADATLDSVRAFVVESGFSRIPVYQGTVDNVVGVLYVKDMLLALLDKRGSMQVRDLMREAYFVPESKKLDDLLSDMRERRVHVAIVIDEFGGTAGMLTLEDVIEEIVGDIFDEYDLRTDPVRQLDPLTAIVDARTHVADVNDALDLDIPEDEGYDTVAGYVYHELGRLGKEGEVVHGPGFDMVVEKVTNRRILRVRFVRHESPAPEAAAEEASAP